MSGFHDARSGHAYFDLVEPSDEPGRAVAAKLSVALFKQARGRVDRTLSEAGGLALSNDMQVRIRARIDFYPPSGRLQLIMQGIDPGFTLGRLAVERERLLHALADEGLLRANRANPIPVLIPCHRVLRSDGSLGGYAFGLPIKERLLDREAVRAAA